MEKELNKEIIYLAICNQIQIYNLLLESEEMDPENRGMAEYILQESVKIEEDMREELTKEKPIKRPNWT